MRSKLFVPGSRPELFAKAMAGAADAISFDLEDAVGEADKATARAALATYLGGLPSAGRKPIVLRVNAVGSEHFAADLRLAVDVGVSMVNLPMVEASEQVAEACAALAALEAAAGLEQPIPLLLNIETPRALRQAAMLAGADRRVAGLQLGLADLFEPLSIDRGDAGAVRQVQLQLRLAAGEAGVAAYDGAYGQIADLDGFRAEAEAARRLGFAGKSCIHPSQVALANTAFSPSAAEIEMAQQVVAAARTQTGAFRVGDRMIDGPFIVRAKAILATAVAQGLVAPETDETA